MKYNADKNKWQKLILKKQFLIFDNLKYFS